MPALCPCPTCTASVVDVLAQIEELKRRMAADLARLAKAEGR